MKLVLQPGEQYTAVLSGRAEHSDPEIVTIHFPSQ